MDAAGRTAWLKGLALERGFDDAGVCLAAPVAGMEHLGEWLAAGAHGEMEYMARHASLRQDPRRMVKRVTHALMVVKAYPPPTAGCGQGVGRISAHALGEDYHEWSRRQLLSLVVALRGAGFKTRSFVDSAPVMEKVLAVAAGLGTPGRNTLFYHRRFGSWVTLAGLYTAAPLVCDQPLPYDVSDCGDCRLCLDACPAGALDERGFLQANRCLSYWLGETSGDLPEEVRRVLGGRLYGCDTCQQVCPRNERAEVADPEPPGGARLPAEVPLEPLLAAPEGELPELFEGTAVARLGGSVVQRNARAIASASSTG